MNIISIIIIGALVYWVIESIVDWWIEKQQQKRKWEDQNK